MYEKPNCVGCKFTKRKLDELKVPYQTVDLTEDAGAFTKVTEEMGYLSAPVVEVDLGDRASWSWMGYAPSQLERLAELSAA